MSDGHARVRSAPESSLDLLVLHPHQARLAGVTIVTVGPFTEEIKVNRDVAPLNKVTTTLTCISHPCPSAQPGDGHFWTVHAPKGDRPQRSHLLCKWLCEPPSWGTVLPSIHLRSRGDADTRHWAQKTVRSLLGV